ncbi:MAG: hypothetical protein MJ252_06925 [archaeon]|nr:hypothetical protein [archaeon]
MFLGNDQSNTKANTEQSEINQRKTPITFRNRMALSRSLENTEIKDSNSSEIMVNRRHANHGRDSGMKDILNWSGKPERSKFKSHFGKGDSLVLGTDDTSNEYRNKERISSDYHPEKYVKEYTPYQRKMFNHFGEIEMNSQNFIKTVNENKTSTKGTCNKEFKTKFNPPSNHKKIRDAIKKETTKEYSTIHKSASKYTSLVAARKQNSQRSNIFGDPDKENFYKNLKSKNKPEIKFYGRAERQKNSSQRRIYSSYDNKIPQNKNYETLNRNHSLDAKGNNYQNKTEEDNFYDGGGDRIKRTFNRQKISPGKKRGEITYTEDLRQNLYRNIRKDNPNENFAQFRRKMDYLTYDEGEKLYETNYKKGHKKVFNHGRYELTNFKKEDDLNEVQKTFMKEGLKMYDIKNESDYSNPKITFNLRNSASKDIHFKNKLGEAEKNLKKEKGFEVGIHQEKKHGRKTQ